METYLIYIGKSALAAGAFYLVYLLLFQNQKQFGASVIISDVVSLEHDGGELLRQMCQQSSDLPLITLMGTLSDSDRTSSGSQSDVPLSTHTLQKPFTLDELLATVQNALTH